MADTISCDVSYYQRGVDNTYPHRWLIYRACDGTFRDPRFAVNHAWAVANSTRSLLHPRATRLDGHTAYVVYRPGVDVFSVVRDMVGPKIPPRFTVMIDAETWGGKITGDHSAELNELAAKLAGWLGDHRRVLGYGNKWDLIQMWPTRPDWLKVIVAGYGSTMPTGVDGAIGWQYSDGQAKWSHPAGLPIASAPFGNCDHNVFPGLAPAQLATLLGVGDPIDIMEEVLAYYPGGRAEFEARMLQLMQQANAHVGSVDHVRHVDLILGGDDAGSYHRVETYLGGVPGFRGLVARGVVKVKAAAKSARR